MANLKTHEGIVNHVATNQYGVMFAVKDLDGMCFFSRDFEGEKPNVQKGQKVRIGFTSTTKNGRTSHYVSKMRVSSTAPAPAAGGIGGSGGSSAEREAGINYNVAVTRAVEVTELLLTHGGIKLGAANNPEARKTQIIGLIDELTAKFYADITTRAPLKAAAAIQKELGGEEEEEPEEDDNELEQAAAVQDVSDMFDDDIPF